MCGVITFLASSSSEGSPLLSRSDREAVAWARKVGRDAVAYCLPGDWLAAEFAAASGCEITGKLEAAVASSWMQAWIGGGFLERLGDEFAARLAEQHLATLLFDVLGCAASPDGTHVIVRDAGRGARDEITAAGPLVLVVSPAAERLSYVSRFRRQQARKNLAALNAQHEDAIEPAGGWQPALPRTRRTARALVGSVLDDRLDAAFGIAAASEPAASQAIAADPRTCAQHLMRYLAHHGLWQRSPCPLEPLTPLATPAARQSPAVSAATTAAAVTLPSRRPRSLGKAPPAFRGPRLKHPASS
jgi:hypothetical protein